MVFNVWKKNVVQNVKLMMIVQQIQMVPNVNQINALVQMLHKIVDIMKQEENFVEIKFVL